MVNHSLIADDLTTPSPVVEAPPLTLRFVLLISSPRPRRAPDVPVLAMLGILTASMTTGPPMFEAI